MFSENPALGLLISGRFWLLKCLITTLLTTIVLMCTPAILIHKTVPLPPAYELKAQHPFADTSTLTIPAGEGERSHGAKLTARVVGSLMLYLVTTLKLHPYLPATLFGLFFLLSGIHIGYLIAGDRLIGLFLGMTFSGLYASSACFTFNVVPKPFDGVAIGLLGLTLISIKRPWLLAIMSFLSCWTDERAMVSLLFIAIFIITYPGLDAKAKLSRCFTIAGSVITYLITRALLSYALQWGEPDMSMMGFTQSTFLLFPLAAWVCFKGGWITIIFAAWVLYTQKDRALLYLLVGSTAFAILFCLLVLDISRTSSFAFPLIPVSYALLKGKGVPQRELYILTGAGAAISLIAPNFEIIAPNTARWIQSLLPLVLLKLFNIAMN